MNNSTNIIKSNDQNTNKSPDYYIEQYWYQLKTSMENFYSEKHTERRNLEKWSKTLNKLKINNEYTKIEKWIMDYITCYGLDIIKSGSGYHLSILHTNIKRWNKLTTLHKIFSNARYKSLFYTCIEVSYCLYKSGFDFKDIFEDIELIVINNNIEELINISLLYNKPSIIDKLLDYDKYLVLDILDLDNININTITSKAIIKLLKNKQKNNTHILLNS